MPPLDTDFIRSQFPAFSEPTLDGWAFFENAGGSYACRQVVDRLTHFYSAHRVQPYGPYPASREAGQAMDVAYTRLAGLLNVGEDEVHLGPSTSQNNYVLAHAIAPLLRPGDEVIVTNQDHEANSGVWRKLERHDVVVREWRVDPDSGHLAPSGLGDLLTDRTRLVVFPHCSNVIGEINPVRECAAMAHAAGARLLVDGVAYAPHGLPDLSELGVDAYLFSLYKTFGPHQGLLYVRRDWLDELVPQCHFFNEDVARKRLVPAGPDHAQIAAAAGVADYIDAIYDHHVSDDAPAAQRARAVHDLSRRHETALLAPLLAWLEGREDVRLCGPTDAVLRAPTVAFQPLRRSIPEVLATLESHRIMAGAGFFYAQRPLQAMGIPTEPGVVRCSFLHYTTEDEVAQLIAALDAAL